MMTSSIQSSPLHTLIPSDNANFEKAPSTSCPKENEVISQVAQQSLIQTDLDHFKIQLLEKYNPKVVHALFEKFAQLERDYLSDEDKNRFEVWCHYFEVESSFKEQIHGTKSPLSRLLNHYLRYTQADVFHRLSHASGPSTLTHENILTCKQNVAIYLSYVDELLETFDECLCHKALTKIPILPSEVLMGIEPMPDFESFKSTIYNYYKPEIELRTIIESGTYEDLRAQSDELKRKLNEVKSYTAAQELYTKLAIKSGRTEWLHSPFSKSLIQSQAELFEVSRLAEKWALEQEQLIPIPGAGKHPSQTEGPVNQNMVFFLKKPEANPSSAPIAVFKYAKKKDSEKILEDAASMEKLVYDAAVIFGFESAFVPTKLKKLKDKPGSLQVYQNGLSWNDFLALENKTADADFSSLSPSKKTLASELDSSSSSVSKVSASPSKINLQDEIIQSISMEDFLKAGLASLLFGNRDLHAGNFFFVQRPDGHYKIVMFDNELSFYHSNYVLIDKAGDCHLPVRNCLLIFPQADVVIEGDLKKRVKKFVQSFEGKYTEFLNYMKSAVGKNNLKGLPHKELGHYQLKAFKARIDKLIQLMESDKNYTYRDIVYRLFPLYESFLHLAKFLFPKHPEMMVGYHPAAELCDQVIKKGYMTEEKKDKFIKEIKKYKYK